MPDSKKDQFAIGLLLLLYAVGAGMLVWGVWPDFVRLTPFNLLVSMILLLWRQPLKDRKFWIFAALCYAAGFLVEMAGVQTGLIFGVYRYGEVLGPKIGGTPLIIGVNWVLLVCGAGTAVNVFWKEKPWWMRAALASVVMVVLDVLIEPVAVALGFWYWENSVIPVQNYVAWYVVAFALLGLFYRLSGHGVNKVALALLVLQFLFFGVLNLSL